MARILIAGCGYVGSALGERLVADRHEVWGLRRKPALLPAGLVPIEADLAVPATLRELPSGLDFVVYAAGPGGRDDAHYRTAYVEGLQRLLEALEQQAQRPQRLFFVSSTSVYSHTGGAWVDETSATRPKAKTAQRLLEGEDVLRGGPYASTVLRLAGIYGPRRSSMVDRVRSGRALFAPGKPRFTNRIHRDDCAGALQHLIGLEAPEDLYLGVDCEPVEEEVILRWLSGALGAPGPRVASAAEQGRLKPASASNKRCSNKRLLESGYAFQYPSFREGYASILKELR